MRRFLCVRPAHWLVAGNPLLLVYVRLDQTCIDRKRFAANKSGRDAHRHHALEHPPQGIALTEAFMPGSAEHRMIGNLILNTELAEPAIGQINLHLGAQPPLRAERKQVANEQHPDHQHRIDRGPTGVRVVRRKLLVHPTQIENAINLAHQMVRWHHLVEIKRIKELDLTILPPTHHASPPLISASNQRNHGSRFASKGVLQHNPSISGPF